MSAKRFILASSGGVYGHGNEAFTETRTLVQGQELGYYLGTKHCAEILADCYRSHMVVHILRLFFVYGIGQHQSMLIPRLVRSVFEGVPIALSGPHGIRLNPVHVSDAVNCIESALKLSTSEKLNVAGERVVTIQELGKLIGSIIGIEPVFFHSDKAAHHLVGDIKKMTRVIGRPVVRLEKGLEELIKASSGKS